MFQIFPPGKGNCIYQQNYLVIFTKREYILLEKLANETMCVSVIRISMFKILTLSGKLNRTKLAETPHMYTLKCKEVIGNK